MKRLVTFLGTLVLAFALVGCAQGDPLTGRAASDLPPGPLKPLPTDSEPPPPNCPTLTPERGKTRAVSDAEFLVITLTNPGDEACTAHGFPTLTMLGADGRSMGERATLRSNGGARYIVVKPHESVQITVRYPKADDCAGRSERIEILVPGATERAFVPEQHAFCPGWSVTSMEPIWPEDSE